MRLVSIALLAMLALPSSAEAQNADAQILEMITLTADKICNVVSDKGQASNSEISGDIKAEIQGLASKLVDAGIKGGAILKNESFQGPLRKDISAYIISNSNCKLEVFSRLQEKLILPKKNEIPSKPETFKVIVCTGQNESSCAGPHNVFYTCGYYGTDEEIAAKVCQNGPPKVLRLHTKSGNRCGYALIEVTCNS
jgi:hypothetical protein